MTPPLDNPPPGTYPSAGKGAAEEPVPVYLVGKTRRDYRARGGPRNTGAGGRPWVLRWRDPPETGPLREKQIGPMSARTAERHRLLWQCELNGFRAETDDDLLWRDFTDRVLADKRVHLARRSFRDLRAELARFTAAARPRLLGEVSRLMVREYLTARLDATSLATAKHSGRVLSQAFGWALEMDLLGANPCAGLRWQRALRTRPDAYTLPETRALLAALHSEPTWLWASLALAANWGPRTGELAGIRAGDVDLREHLVRIRPGKTRSDRCVPLDPETGGLLQELMHRPAGEGVLWGPCDRPLRSEWGARGFRRVLVLEARRVLETAGLGRPAQPIQKLRRTAETNLRRRGVDRFTVSKILGHGPRVGDAWYDGRDVEEFARALVDGEAAPREHRVSSPSPERGPRDPNPL